MVRAGGRFRTRHARRARLLGLDHHHPRSRSVSRFSWVAVSRYIQSFIAGATSRGAVQARKRCSPSSRRARRRAWRSCWRRQARPDRRRRWRPPRGGRSDRAAARDRRGKAPRTGSRSNSSLSTGAPTIEGGGADEALGRRVISTRTAWPSLVARRATRAPCRRRSLADSEQDAGHWPSSEARPCTRT